jgi:hypothetical protein
MDRVVEGDQPPKIRALINFEAGSGPRYAVREKEFSVCCQPNPPTRPNYRKPIDFAGNSWIASGLPVIREEYC